jgi:2-octaprenyl-3-methyl-6-methoxy-1,4-benzoquinol hydroxylase
VLACDGAESHTRQLAGIGVSRFEYRQHCMLINIDTDRPGRHHLAAVHPERPARLPAAAGPPWLLVWYDSPARIRALAAMSNEALAAEVRRHFPSRLGGFTVTAKGASPGAPPRQRLPRRPGGAAGRCRPHHQPAGGQGVNLGFKDVACWAGLLGKAGHSGISWRWPGATRGDAAPTTC